MKNVILAFAIIVSLIIVFFAGIKWTEFQYLDICLDMGGGINPSDNHICVIEKFVDKY